MWIFWVLHPCPKIQRLELCCSNSGSESQKLLFQYSCLEKTSCGIHEIKHWWLKIWSKWKDCYWWSTVIRNSSGHWMCGFQANLGVGEVLDAETWGLFNGLKLAVDCNITNLVLESDSAILVNSLLTSKICILLALSFLAAKIWCNTSSPYPSITSSGNATWLLMPLRKMLSTMSMVWSSCTALPAMLLKLTLKALEKPYEPERLVATNLVSCPFVFLLFWVF